MVQSIAILWFKPEKVFLFFCKLSSKLLIAVYEP